MNPLLSIRSISKHYSGVAAVDGIDLEVKEGEFLTFLGPSGSGKSTLLYMIAGIETATGGDILLNGTSLLRVPPHKRNIGMVFQRYTLFPTMTIDENIAFPLRARGWDRDKIEARVAEMLDLVRLAAFKGRRPSQLSGGQQQRVALARALAYHPRILLMDEPLAALDKKLKEEIQSEIRRIHKATGVTILYVTHDQEEAIRLADRVAVFNAGRIEQVAEPATLYEEPASRFVAGFVGNSNFLTVKISTIKLGHASATFPDGTQIDRLHLQDALIEGDAAQVLLRPERLRFQPVGQGGALAVTIRDVTYLGESFDIAAETAWGETVFARVPKRSSEGTLELSIGQQIGLAWPEVSLLAFAAIDPSKTR
ncbi:putative spermidine/putrescine transport system ATP-binding protein [Rhodoligotrophos appendicifer]|uniref:ABC transporter ATP-binding protein n=1 Tax=Rhodoligotrophos appendicifer TaxID=987056 RepID=UPI0014793238|nr:ABC transporter ATP-binding protein [Rhodoligotrophos appendicifer]